MNSSPRSSWRSSKTRRCETQFPPRKGKRKLGQIGRWKGHRFYRERKEEESSRQEFAFLRHCIYRCGLKTGTNQHTNNTPATGESSKQRIFVFRQPSPPPNSPPFTYPCFKIRVGALLSEHDVLFSKSCIHLPRHLHAHTCTYTHSHSLFHLSSSSSALFGGPFPLSCSFL